MVVPFVDVSHLAASTSFYSAVLQPLRLEYIDSSSSPRQTDSSAQPRQSVTYGANGRAVLQIRQAPASDPSPRLSSLVLTAPSRSAVGRFHACGLTANPLLEHLHAPPPGPGPAPQAQSTWTHTAWLGIDHGGASHAVVHDLDGNRMEVVYPDPRPRRDPVHYTGDTVRKTQSTRDEVGRILDWNYGVASAAPAASSRVPAPASATSPASHRGEAMPQRPRETPHPLSRSLTSDARFQHPPQPAPSQVSQQEDPGTGAMNTTTVVGALLGAAAGAALTYGLVAREKGRAPRHEVDAGPSPGVPRRATFPERVATAHPGHGRHDDYKKPRFADGDADTYAGRRVVYADVAADHEGAWPAQKYLDQRPYQDVGTTSRSAHSVAKSAPRSRAVDDAFDTRSRHSSRFAAGRARSTRSRSEAPVSRVPLEPLDFPPRSSAVSSRHSAAPAPRAPPEPLDLGPRTAAPSRHCAVPRSSHSVAHSQRHVREPELDSYVSARTHRSAATAQQRYPPGPPEPGLEQDLVYRSRAGSKASTAKPPPPSVVRPSSNRGPSSYVSARSVPLPPSHVGSSAKRGPASYVSARNVALPASDVGSSHANWDDDLASVAPSDSISCVGSKASRRSRKHH